jgi:hypothetical protein
MLFAAVHESAIGTKRTTSDVRSSVAFGGEAEVARTTHFGSDWPGAEVALFAKSYRLAVATVGAAWLSPISATTTPTT